jgi:2-polyprenyl-3-methyl-5-hydroxy-6-metoxy-1,4-benzoquinol methylase
MKPVTLSACEAPTLDFLDAHAGTSPLTVTALRSLLDHQPAYEAIVLSASYRDGDFWLDAEARCWEILRFCDDDPARFDAAVLQWIEFSYEFLSKQQKFLKSGHYASDSFDKIRRELYDDEERMKNFYLIALMFSFIYSSNYVGFYAFFRENLLPRVAKARSVCDVGCGHGVYLSRMLLAAPESVGIGVDISEASLATSARLLSFRDISTDRYSLRIGDVQAHLPVDDASQDAVTCFEVIEHLERPEAALAELRRILRPGGLLCLSTAIRMESVDHIHLFQDPGEVRKLLGAAGLTLIADEVIPLTNADFRDQAARDELIANPRTALGYVALLS